MDETEEFLTAAMPRYVDAEIALHNGDSGPRVAMWSHSDPVTLFGAAVTTTGWTEVGRVFDWLASSFSNCSSYRNEVVAAGASGDLAYIVALEHTTTSIHGEPQQYVLRATTVFRREQGEWKVVHRHGDSLSSPASSDVVDAIAGGSRTGQNLPGTAPDRGAPANQQ